MEYCVSNPELGVRSPESPEGEGGAAGFRRRRGIERRTARVDGFPGTSTLGRGAVRRDGHDGLLGRAGPTGAAHGTAGEQHREAEAEGARESKGRAMGHAGSPRGLENPVHGVGIAFDR